MSKKIAKFYLISIFGAAIFYCTVGAVPGWFVTESESFLGCVLVSVLAFILLLWCTKLLIKDIFQNTETQTTDVWQLLAPYMVAIGVFLLLFLVNIFKDWLPLPEMLYYIIDEGFLKFGLAFLLPVSYSVVVLSSIFDLSYLVFYSTAILYSILHMLAIAVLFIQQIKKNAEATPRE
ncbi:MAG: hypothetical protein Q4E21_01240 [Clostridia bacterium]|nr:hypothetical protein [Clostridia bacterium]